MVSNNGPCLYGLLFIRLLVSPIRRYDEITSNGLVRSDPGQREVIKKLDDLWYELRQYKPKAYKEQGKSRSVSSMQLMLGMSDLNSGCFSGADGLAIETKSTT